MVLMISANMQRTISITWGIFFSLGVFLISTLAQPNERGVRQPLPPGLVYVSQKIDLRQQLSAEETIFSLDGEPVPQLQTTSVTLGLLLDQAGHIVTRLGNNSTQDAPPQLMVMLSGERGGQFPASFIGMDSVTGLCLLKVENLPVSSVTGITKTATGTPSPLNQRPIQIFGFNPRQKGVGMPGLTLIRPRIYNSAGIVRKALEDFRFSANNPIYYLTAPSTLTPIQDCSVAVERDGTVLGLVLYDTTGEEQHLVYPLSRVQQLAAMILENKRVVVPHAWLGATSGNHDPQAVTAVPNKLTNKERGVLIAAVFPDSPAEQAGVLPNDMLVSISGKPLLTGADLSSTLRQLPANSEVTLKVRRGNEFKLLPARLTPAPATDAKQQLRWIVNQLENYERLAQQLPETDPNRSKQQSKANAYRSILNGISNPAPPEIWLKLMYGIETIALTPQLAKSFAAPGGVLISSLTPTGKSAQAGLKVGDVLVKIGEDTVVDSSSLMQALSQAKGGNLEVLTIRDGKTLTLNLGQ